MKRSWPIPFFLLLLALVACGDSARPTPTPFPPTSTPVPTAAGGDPISVALSDLAANPEAYEGAYIQLTGQYRRLPRLVCRTDRHSSPATWGIAGDDFLAPASGYETQLRALLPENLTVTVAGVWRQWQGLVGCGKRAVRTQIWYLEGRNILSPSPIAQVTLTPTFAGAVATGVAAALDTTTGTPTPTAATAEEPTAEFTEPAPLPTDTLPAATAVTPTRQATAAATNTPPTGGTPTTAGPIGTASPTPTSSAPASATPTGSANTYTVLEVDEIEPGNLGFEELGAFEKHNWLFYPFGATTTITVSVAAEPAVNVVLAVLDGAQTPLIERNQAPAGQLETIAGFTVDPEEDYYIQVYATNGAPSDYSMIVWDNGSLVLNARGYLGYGDAVSGTTGEAELHYWYFAGNEDDSVTIRVTSNDGVFFVGLYGPDADDLAYEEEEITVTLPQTGLYTIELGESAVEPATYQVSLTGN
ncbi:MAG TPA: hypothetical protein VF177_23495 [Anaerolineae bacterium]